MGLVFRPPLRPDVEVIENKRVEKKNSLEGLLQGKLEQEALELRGARTGTHIYNPDRQMKGWVWIPFEHSDKWTKFTQKAIGQGRSKTTAAQDL